MTAFAHGADKTGPEVDIVDVCPQAASCLPRSDPVSPADSLGSNLLGSSILRLDAPSGHQSSQKAPFHRTQVPEAIHNDQSGSRSLLSAETIHQNVMDGKWAKQYYSITTMPPPFMSWKPLDSRQDMETRPCFQPASRIHLLTCGHHVAMHDTAESCAANCAHSLLNVSESVSIPTRHATNILKIRANAAEGLQAYIGSRIRAGDSRAEADSAIHFAALTNIWNKQDASLQPTALLTDGDFACTLCGTKSGRPTYPAIILQQSPYSCIVVGRNAHDLAIVHALCNGVRPREPRPPPCGLRRQRDEDLYMGRPYRSFSRPSHRCNGRDVGPRAELIHAGHRQGDALMGSVAEHFTAEKKGRTSFREERERRRQGWLSKRRRTEKDEVVGRLREEFILKGMEDTTLGNL